MAPPLQSSSLSAATNALTGYALSRARGSIALANWPDTNFTASVVNALPATLHSCNRVIKQQIRSRSSTSHALLQNSCATPAGHSQDYTLEESSTRQLPVRLPVPSQPGTQVTLSTSNPLPLGA